MAKGHLVNYFARIKKSSTFKPVFIGYGLKTGQGVYPGPIYFKAHTRPPGRFSLNYFTVSKTYPSPEKYARTMGKATFNTSKALVLS